MKYLLIILLFFFASCEPVTYYQRAVIIETNATVVLKAPLFYPDLDSNPQIGDTVWILPLTDQLWRMDSSDHAIKAVITSKAQ